MRAHQISSSAGVAFYVGALLGPSLLLLPGLAARIAGPASLLAWLALLALSGLLARIFLVLGRDMPEAGGVAGYARAGFGPVAERVVGWCFLCGVVLGAPVVCLIGAAYVVDLVGGGRLTTALVAGAVLSIVVTRRP